MKIAFDPEADAVYIRLIDTQPPRPVTTVPVETTLTEQINLDLGGDGRQYGIEVLDARALLPPAFLDRFANRTVKPA
jgi:uncharacterized protein YuzE